MSAASTMNPLSTEMLATANEQRVGYIKAVRSEQVLLRPLHDSPVDSRKAVRGSSFVIGRSTYLRSDDSV